MQLIIRALNDIVKSDIYNIIIENYNDAIKLATDRISSNEENKIISYIVKNGLNMSFDNKSLTIKK